ADRGRSVLPAPALEALAGIDDAGAHGAVADAQRLRTSRGSPVCFLDTSGFADRILRTDHLSGACPSAPEVTADQLGRRCTTRRDGDHGYLEVAARGEGHAPVPGARWLRPRRPHAAARPEVHERRLAQPCPAPVERAAPAHPVTCPDRPAPTDHG